MRYTILIAILILFLYSCNKDKFQTKPSLKYKSVNTTILNRNQDLVFTLEFTDAEGDVTGSVIVKELVKACPANPDSGFVQPYPVPSFPSGKNQKGDITVSFNYNEVNPLCNRNDTAIFKFVLEDKAHNKSDTAVSEPVVIIF